MTGLDEARSGLAAAAAERPARRRGRHAGVDGRGRTGRCWRGWRASSGSSRPCCPGTRCAGGSASWPARSAWPRAPSPSRPATSRCSPRPRSARCARRRRAARPRCRTSSNPVAAVAALGCALPAPGLVATLLAAMVQEHERAAGAWHAEWRPLVRPARRRRLGRGLAAHVAGGPPGRRRPHAGQPRRRTPTYAVRAASSRRPRAGGLRMIPSHHVVTGPADAPALVLSNSLGADAAMWDPQADALAERFRLVRYDTRGHGGSPVPARPVHDRPTSASDLIGAARPPGDRARARGRALARRHDRHVAGHPRARAGGPARAAVHVGPARPARDLVGPGSGRARAQGTGAVAEAGVGRWLTAGSARRTRDDRGLAARHDRRHARRRLRRLLRGDRAHGPDAGPRSIPAPTLVDRRRAGPGDAAGARRADRRRHRRTPAWSCSTRPRTWPTSSSRRR